MFLKINEGNYICFDYGMFNMSRIETVCNEWLINIDLVSEITINKCSIKQNINGKIVEIKYKIAFDKFVEEGSVNYLTLFFEDSNNEEYQRIKRDIESLIINKKENTMSQSNHNADIKNGNKGTEGANRTYDQNQGNRGKQMNPNQNKEGISK